jgi:hypothetical protein
MKALGGALLTEGLIDIIDLEVLDKWVSDLKKIDYEDTPVIPRSIAKYEPCIGMYQ